MMRRLLYTGHFESVRYIPVRAANGKLADSKY
jgi:hypothetical protein